MYPKSLQQLIEKFRMLPGVGEKTAERYAFSMLDQNKDDVIAFANALVNMKDKVHYCKECGNLCEDDMCEICKDASRDHSCIFVVQSPKDVIAMEKTNEYHGVYHVLHGLISTTKGIMPEDLNIDSLLQRAKYAHEVILATNTTMDGETTAMYIDKLLKESCENVVVSRIAHGLPTGGMLDYADEITLVHALSDRKKM